MRVIQVKDYQEMSDVAADFLAGQIFHKPHSVLGLATGGTPEGTYKSFIQKARHKELPLSELTTFNLDEYEGLSPEHPNSYHMYMNEHLFQPLELSSTQTYLPKGDAENVEKEARRYEQMIQDHGGIDLQLLGIGENGHIGFNEPGTSFTSRTHVEHLKPTTREANARYFEKKEDVPERAITMGIATIMDSRSIILLASGDRKKQAVKKLVEEVRKEEFPASSLKIHPYVTIIADEAALSAVSTNTWTEPENESLIRWTADKKEWEIG
ncbi:glucosamine-6-phosphate deaminase [Salibacterium salarium]|uniref:Glucosamine-6-phosphate deaminase n=1 Tax=Salibacterium salarium TaxID=284579 RepID=A0A3R9PJK7_9BACI|nr:glucosamine-6-phosphate deaminase [Salibacterium salarium]RSL32198.1 glucosamine-6-phosphate deaminase [Salibacterium salarium]